MHPTSVFHWTDRAAQLAFVEERAYLTLVGHVAGALTVAQAPAIRDVDDDTRLLLHLSRANPIARALPMRVVAIAHGPDAYVSPDWYTATEQVPTWNYVSVEIDGVLTATDDAMLIAILDRQSAVYESRIPDKRPWTTAKLPPAVLAAKLKGIVGVTFSIEAVRATRKLSQNKTPDDRAGVVAALATSARPMDRAIADAMREKSS
ncbi:MAG: FMN-binding negative transcriptional regulator [Deltaproteobacteria bacterium]|nr:FMN-binding negative transcriptional regulator [Deltaproteobacteria bacterium]